MKHSSTPLTLKNGKAPVKIDLSQTKEAALILRALNHKLRQQILKLIDGKKKITVTEIYAKLHIEQPVASLHLSILRKAGIVSTIRNGKYIYYSPNYDHISEIEKFAVDLVG